MFEFSNVKKLTYSAVLVALGVIIPMVMPIKIMVPPVSFTLASHVPIFLSMFISPGAAVAVAIGTGVGFMMTAPFTIALRAFSHIIFAVAGAYLLQQRPEILSSKKKNTLFNLGIGALHSIVEMAVVFALFMTKSIPNAEYTTAYLVNMMLILGVGGLIHSMVDYYIAFYVAQRTINIFSFPAFLRVTKAK